MSASGLKSPPSRINSDQSWIRISRLANKTAFDLNSIETYIPDMSRTKRFHALKAAIEAHLTEFPEDKSRLAESLSDFAGTSFLRAISRHSNSAERKQSTLKRREGRGALRQIDQMRAAGEALLTPGAKTALWQTIELPPGLSWPADTYSEAAAKGENIVSYLDRAWKELIAAGIGTRQVIESRDFSVLDGIRNYTRTNKRTGNRRRIPENLQPLTRSDVIDRALAEDPTLVFRDRRMAMGNANRLRRHNPA